MLEVLSFLKLFHQNRQVIVKYAPKLRTEGQLIIVINSTLVSSINQRIRIPKSRIPWNYVLPSDQLKVENEFLKPPCQPPIGKPVRKKSCK